MLAATFVGLAMAVWAIRSTGIDNILAVGQRLGFIGFLVYCAYSLGVFVLLGAGWLVAAGEPFGRLGLFTRARLLREAAADLLPFSQIGGIALSMLLLVSNRLTQARAYSSFIIDLLGEMASQVAFTAFGLGLLLAIPIEGKAHDQGQAVIATGLCIFVALTVLVLLTNRSGFSLVQKLARRFMPSSAQSFSEIGAELRRAAMPGRMGLVFVLNLIAWIASALGAWIALRMMGIEFPLWKILSLESAIFALRSVAFAIPAGIGVQEAGYALLSPLIGLPAEAALALALAKRARDIVIALPTLILWSLAETRSLVSPQRKSDAA